MMAERVKLEQEMSQKFTLIIEALKIQDRALSYALIQRAWYIIN